MINTEFSPWPSYTQEEADRIQSVLLSNKVNYWTGIECREFEKEFTEFTGCEYAVALANGTLALELALHVLGIGAGDEVIVTPRTFIASVSAIAVKGAIPIFAEVDADTQNITAESIRAVLTPKSTAIIAVHLAGWSCEMDAIMKLAEEQGLKVIEDCAQAHGAVFQGRPVGSIGHIAAWSFCQDKIMTTGGEGGMLTTNNEDLWKKIWSFKDHGKSWDAIYNQVHPLGYRWLHESFGSNYRMTELQGAIGRIQLKRMPKWHTLRSQNAQLILSAARECPGLRVPNIPGGIDHAWYKCYVFVKPETLKSGWNRDRIMNEIHAKGVPCFSGTCAEVYLEKAFDNTGIRPTEKLPIAQMLGETSLMFLVHPTLTEAEITKTCSAIKEVMRSATRVDSIAIKNTAALTS
jgi:dTDP-4-amino-4,6-dideoxygalactose transaminase